MMPNFVISLLLMLFFSSMVQADATQREPNADEMCIGIGQWIETKPQQTLQHSTLIEQLTHQQVVLLGEDHNNAEHHRWQLQTMTGLYLEHPNLALGFEAFPRGVQPILDQWVAGEMGEVEFLKAVDWESIWSYDSSHYLPMFHFARMNRIPIYALNVDRTLVKLVKEKGWDNISVDDREGVTDPAPPSDEYAQMLASVYEHHLPKHHAHQQDKSQADSESINESAETDAAKVDLQDPAFKKFVQSQQLWDRAMAQVVHDAVMQDKDKLFIGIMGAGHIVNDFGVPHQLNALGTTKHATLLAWDGSIACEQLTEGVIDYAFGVESFVEPESIKPRLGVYLEQTEKGVNVSRLVSGSIAEKIGIKKDDIFRVAAGRSVAKISDVVKAVQGTAFGTWLPLTLLRHDVEIEIVAKFPMR